MSAGLLRNSFKGAASAAPFFPTLLDQMPNAIVVFAAENQQLVYVNPAAETALDLSRKSLEGQSVHDLFGDAGALNEMISEVSRAMYSRNVKKWFYIHCQEVFIRILSQHT